MAQILQSNNILYAVKDLDLTNQNQQLSYKEIYSEYVKLLKNKSKSYLKELKHKDPELYSAIVESNLLSASFIVSPEVSFLLLFNHNNIESYSLFRRLVIAEKAKNERKGLGGYQSLWTSDGSFFISLKDDNDFFIYESPLLLKKIPIDFISPFSSLIKNEEMGESDSLKIKNYDPDDFSSIFEFLVNSTKPLNNELPFILDFVSLFTLTIIPKKHSGNYFSSGSNGFYIGRTVLTNLDLASKELLIEAIVHEATHSYLYMIESLSPWMPDFDASKKIGNNIASCWTGNKISIRSFFQAIFIWYTLFNFWSICKKSGIYNQEFVTQRLSFIKMGFEKLDLDYLQNSFNFSVSDVTKEVIIKTQTKILNTK